MKTLYFIRHAESETNNGSAPRGVDAALSEAGKEQAESIGARMVGFPIERIISSTMARSKETAEAIARHTGVPIEETDLLVERRRPSEQRGMPDDDPEFQKAEEAVIAHFGKPGFRYSDEENCDDLIARARDTFALLSGRPEEHIAVVTHGFFMRIIAAYATFGDALTPAECEQFVRKYHLENTSLSIFKEDKVRQDNTSPWWLWVWNDHSHLQD